MASLSDAHNYNTVTDIVVVVNMNIFVNNAVVVCGVVLCIQTSLSFTDSDDVTQSRDHQSQTSLSSKSALRYSSHSHCVYCWMTTSTSKKSKMSLNKCHSAERHSATSSNVSRCTLRHTNATSAAAYCLLLVDEQNTSHAQRHKLNHRSYSTDTRLSPHLRPRAL